MIRKIAIVGSHGLYANYGGWDELVKNLAERKPESLHYLIFNSVDSPPQAVVPEGVSVRQLNVKADGYQGILYDFWSILLCYRKVDAILLLGVQGGPLISLLRIFKKVRIVSNVGGIEWLRPKFGFFQKQYLRWCFNLSMVNSDIVILDNPHHRSFLPRKVTAKIMVIPYGGEIDTSLNVTEDIERKYPFIRTDYSLSVSRSLEDNQIDPLCQSFIGSRHKLVVISNLSSTPYGQRILKKYKDIPNLILIDGLYHKPELDLIRRQSKAYIHTHTLCGTAPSLVEMMIAQRPILSVDNPQNRFTMNEEGFFFTSFDQVQELLDSGDDLKQFIPSEEVCERYAWGKIVAEYESCFNPL
jgi:hypothetical protein